MRLYLHDGKKTLGPFEASEVTARIDRGEFKVGLMACPVGETEWRSIYDVLNLDSQNAKVSNRSSSNGTKSLLDSTLEKIASAAGVEHLDRAASKEMFSAVLRKRSEQDLESQFSVGTPATTPPLEQIDASWPQPWMFFKALLGSILAFGGLYYVVAHFENPNAIPAVLMVGAFAVPCSVLVMFFEFNVPRNFSLYQMLRLTMLGGVLSLVTCLFLFGWASGIGLDWMGASVAGLVEEPAKLMAMLIVANQTRYRWTLNGLLIGACVGTGFAVVETAGYAFQSLIIDMQSGSALTEGTLFARALLYPLGGHALLSAIAGAALWRIKRGRKFEWSMLSNPQFLRLFAVSVVLHTLWNSPLELPFYAKYLGIGFVAWTVVLSLIQSGLKEIRRAQAEANAPPPERPREAVE